MLEKGCVYGFWGFEAVRAEGGTHVRANDGWGGQEVRVGCARSCGNARETQGAKLCKLTVFEPAVAVRGSSAADFACDDGRGGT